MKRNWYLWLVVFPSIFFGIVGLVVVARAQSPGPVLPQAEHAPGWRNREVRQSNLATTVCKRGFTSTIRPPVSYTSYLKRAELRYLKLPGIVSDYQLDHELSLELGGSPYDTRNLWMQPSTQAHRDDRMENTWHRQLCAGSLTLKQAQHAELAWKQANG